MRDVAAREDADRRRASIRSEGQGQRRGMGACASISRRSIASSRMHGWDDMIFTHISARVPGPEHHFLINPYGLLFEEITASAS